MPNRLFLIDGHALVFKMYYAFLGRPMINTKGMDMSILYGFTKYLLELIEKEQPTHLAVAFDPPGGTFRNQLYPEYKANRPPTPQLVIDALQPLTEIVKAMNIPVLTIPGFEADDVIGSIATQNGREGTEVYMVTPDKDYGQLVNPHVFQYKPGKGGAEGEILGEKEICDKWKISSCSQVVDMLAICGDASDNVPGVKGVGDKGAAKLLSRYGSMEAVVEHMDELPPRQEAMFREAAPHLPLSKVLVTIKTDMDIPVKVEEMRLDTEFTPRLAELFQEYEFNSLRRYLPKSAPVPKADTAAPGQPSEMKEVPFRELEAAARRAGVLGVVALPSGSGIFARVESLFLGCEGLAAACMPGEAKSLLEDASVAKYGTDLKYVSHLLRNEGISLGGLWKDIRLMHYVISPEQSHDVAALMRGRIGIEIEEESGESVALSLFDEAPEDEAPAKPASRLTEAAFMNVLGRNLEKELPSFYDSMEEPLAKVLASMEREGVKVDPAPLADFAEKLRGSISAREKRIREMTGEAELNISSPKQVGDVLFDKLRLDPKAKKSARGQYSTDEATLMALFDRHPVIGEILDFRAEKKLLSTYIEPFPSYISPVDGRVHTTFNQALTATGRLSSSNPNLQNIPVRTEMGKEIRKAFVAGSPDGIIVSADYSQIELRIMAHLSCDEHLVKAFRDGVDVHAATAAKIFRIPVEEVTREQRTMAKTANFGIMYGISSFGLSQRLGIGRKAAKELIDGYFESFPSIQSFIADSIAFARDNGYVETLFGRRRYLPDIGSRNANVRALAERNAVNAPIQGTSADIIKLAMIRVQKRLDQASLRSRMVLQIHDELLFDAFPDELETLRAIVVEEMENVIKLSVPLTVECSAGKNWLDAH